MNANQNEVTTQGSPTKKKVVFDPNIQVIGTSCSEEDKEGNTKVLSQEFEGMVLQKLLAPTYNDTKKLFSAESKTTLTAPPSFLSNLQNIVAHKASNNESTPSQSDMSDETEEGYVKDESGRWVSKSKLASIKRLEEINRELYRDDQPNPSADNT